MKSSPVTRFQSYAFAGVLSLVLLGSFISTPSKAYAATLYAQLDGTTVESPSTNGGTQSLGNGLSGSVSALSIKATTTVATAQVGWQIIRCNVNNVSDGSCVSVVDHSAVDRISMIASGVQTLYQTFTPYTFDASKYYFLYLAAESVTSGRFAFYGSTNASSYSAGEYASGARNIKDVFFVLSDVGNTQYSGVGSVIAPTEGQVLTSAANVRFDFTWYQSGTTYDRAGFFLRDLTALQSVDTTALDTTISSGSGEYVSYKDLVEGHIYQWTPYLYSSTASSTYAFGPATNFFTPGSNRSTYTTPKPNNPFATTSSSTAFWLSTTTGRVTWTGGTTTSLFQGVLDPDLDALLATKAPFSYLYDFTTLLDELANGTGGINSCANSDAYYTLPTGSLGTHLSNGSTTVKIIDACAVQNFSTTQEIRKVISYALYLITAAALIALATSII